jgi:hypothetical protein
MYVPWNPIFLILAVVGLVIGIVGIWDKVRTACLNAWHWLTYRPSKMITFKVTNCVLSSPPQPPHFPTAMVFEPDKPYTLTRAQFEDLSKRAVNVKFEIIAG